MHIDCRNLVVSIGSIIIYSFVSIAAGGIEAGFVLAIAHIAAAFRLLNRTQDMKELIDTL